MAMNGPIDRLRQFLRELSPQARALLTAELERAALRGDDVPGGDLVLQEVRNAARVDSEEDAPRVGNAARLFFRPFEPFLASRPSRNPQPGRIPRDALDAVWTWLGRDVMPHELRLFSEDVNRALGGGEIGRADALAVEFQDQVAVKIRNAMETGDDKARRRLLSQANIPAAMLDDCLAILQERDTLDLVAQRLPEHVTNLTSAELEMFGELLDKMTRARPRAMRLALILVMRRLVTPWQLIRLPIHDGGHNDPARLASTRFGDAIAIVLGDIEGMVGELTSSLSHPGEVKGGAVLKSLHDALRGLRTELDLSADASARQISAIRTQIAESLTAAIDPLPGRIRQMLRIRTGKDRPAAAPDAADIAEIGALIDLAKGCRNFAREFAVAELAARVWSELEGSLDVLTRALIDSMRGQDPNIEYRQAQFQAAVRFTALVFGQDHATRLSRSAELAAAERKAIPA